MGVATLIMNVQSSQEYDRNLHLYRMIGSITLSNSFIKIVPVITKDQQARKKRSLVPQDDHTVSNYKPEFDFYENTHKIKVDSVPQFACADPVVAGKISKIQPHLNRIFSLPFSV